MTSSPRLTGEPAAGLIRVTRPARIVSLASGTTASATFTGIDASCDLTCSGVLFATSLGSEKRSGPAERTTVIVRPRWTRLFGPGLVLRT